MVGIPVRPEHPATTLHIASKKILEQELICIRCTGSDLPLFLKTLHFLIADKATTDGKNMYIYFLYGLFVAVNKQGQTAGLDNW